MDRASGCPVYSAGAKNTVPRVGGSTPTFAEFFFLKILPGFGRKTMNYRKPRVKKLKLATQPLSLILGSVKLHIGDSWGKMKTLLL